MESDRTGVKLVLKTEQMNVFMQEIPLVGSFMSSPQGATFQNVFLLQTRLCLLDDLNLAREAAF